MYLSAANKFVVVLLLQSHPAPAFHIRFTTFVAV